MDVQNIRNTLKIIALILLGVGSAALLTSCQKAKEPLRAEVQAFYPVRVAYHMSQYEQHGRKNASWDKTMRTLIEETDYHTYSVGPGIRDSLLKAFDDLDKAKCSDPYFLALSAQYLPARIAHASPSTSYTKAHLAMRESNYAPILKFTTAHGAAQESYDPTDPTKRRIFQKLQAEAFEYLLEAVADPDIPDELIAFPAESYFEWSSNAKEPLQEIQSRAQRIETAVRQHRPDRALMLRMMGQIEINQAWGLRSNDWASDVTPEGWAGFAEHLAAAEALLERSWALLPNSRTAGYMMTVELGQHRGRERLEMWFERAMELNPAGDRACYSKLHYLRPRWYGSHEEMLQFGVECVENPKWQGQVPLVLAQAMVSYIDDYPKADQARLWQNPKVWALVKKSYEAYLKKYPDDNAARHDYLLAAHRSAAWDDFEKQLKKIGSIQLFYIPKDQLDTIMDDYANYLTSKAQQ